MTEIVLKLEELNQILNQPPRAISKTAVCFRDGPEREKEANGRKKGDKRGVTCALGRNREHGRTRKEIP
jgi:hypothetical protein